jgi:hypothetical protein
LHFTFIRDDAFEEDAVATGAVAAPEETEEDFAMRASAFNTLAEVEDEEEDGYVFKFYARACLINQELTT